jgi:hypothetical protein
MTEFVWADVRDRAIRLFRGEPLHAETETALLDVFERHPQRVVETIERVAGQENVRSCWAVTLAELRRVENSGARTVSGEGERAERIARAETWIRNAGLHFDREPEVEEELFVRGRLRPYADDELFRKRLLDLWRELRPTGERIEADADRRLAPRPAAVRR